ncbi:unnamed protein product [Psylliodes chrysocephalus]|uniref:Uncharacterized protein n=1 Tax=Psylliodes chrysocephalus TaxID=3402493 RepID=A0A9P0CXF8_9CUCU|nr:unnamed protein product [Psylliodes chrysocephala]
MEIMESISERGQKLLIVEQLILVALTPDNKEILCIKPPKGKTLGATYSPKSLDHLPVAKENILFLYAISGCDTTSAFYGKGKTKLAEILKKSTELEDAGNCLNNLLLIYTTLL